MKFSVTTSLGAVYHEIVEDCTTVKDFINRHFGSIIPSECGLIVEMVEDNSNTPPPIPFENVINELVTNLDVPEEVIKETFTSTVEVSLGKLA